MRTTLNIDDKTYEIVKSLASSNRKSVSQTVDQLLAKALEVAPQQADHDRCLSDPETGFPIFRSKQIVTDEDVKALEDEE